MHSFVFHGWIRTAQVESHQALLKLCPLPLSPNYCDVPLSLRERGKFPHGPDDLVFIVEKILSVETTIFCKKEQSANLTYMNSGRNFLSFRTITKINDFLCLHIFFFETQSHYIAPADLVFTI